MNPPEFAFKAELREHTPNGLPHQLLELLNKVFPLEYKMTNSSPKNSCQLNSTFDQQLLSNLQQNGFEPAELELPDGFSAEYEFDAAFNLPEIGKVVVEVEKADHQKILYDLLKAHIYLRAGAAYVLLLIPTTRGRKGDVNLMFEIGRKRLSDCLKSGMIGEDAKSKIFIVGFEQVFRNESFNESHRKEMQAKCRDFWKPGQKR